MIELIALMIVVFPLCKSRALSEKSRHCGSILAHFARPARNQIKGVISFILFKAF